MVDIEVKKVPCSMESTGDTRNNRCRIRTETVLDVTVRWVSVYTVAAMGMFLVVKEILIGESCFVIHTKVGTIQKSYFVIILFVIFHALSRACSLVASSN